MEIKTDQVKVLREKTGISIMQCRKALEEAEGDLDKAVIILQKKSKDVASKKEGRTLGAGVVASYIHSTGNVGTLVELLCETDFVAKNEEFIKLARDIAMQATATSPQFIKMEDIDEKSMNTAKEVFAKDVEGKPDDIKLKIMDGKLSSYWSERVLLEQAFIKDPEVTVKTLIERAVQKFGEKMELSRFVRYSVN